MDNLGDLPPKGEVRRGVVPFAGTPTRSEVFPNRYILNWPKVRAGSVGDVSMAIHMYSKEEANSNTHDYQTAITFDSDGNIVPLGKARDALNNGYGFVFANITPRIDRAESMEEEQYISLGINHEISITGEVDSRSSDSGDIAGFWDAKQQDLLLPNDPELLSKIRLSITSKPKGGE